MFLTWFGHAFLFNITQLPHHIKSRNYHVATQFHEDRLFFTPVMGNLNRSKGVNGYRPTFYLPRWTAHPSILYQVCDDRGAPCSSYGRVVSKNYKLTGQWADFLTARIGCLRVWRWQSVFCRYLLVLLLTKGNSRSVEMVSLWKACSLSEILPSWRHLLAFLGLCVGHRTFWHWSELGNCAGSFEIMKA